MGFQYRHVWFQEGRELKRFVAGEKNVFSNEKFEIFRFFLKNMNFSAIMSVLLINEYFKSLNELF